MKPIHNPYSWNNNASMIFLEQPLGVGFSYGDEKVSSTKLAGKDAYIFLELFLKLFLIYAPTISTLQANPMQDIISLKLHMRSLSRTLKERSI